jgi:hypothetical protein
VAPVTVRTVSPAWASRGTSAEHQRRQRIAARPPAAAAGWIWASRPWPDHPELQPAAEGPDPWRGGVPDPGRGDPDRTLRARRRSFPAPCSSEVERGRGEEGRGGEEGEDTMGVPFWAPQLAAAAASRGAAAAAGGARPAGCRRWRSRPRVALYGERSGGLSIGPQAEITSLFSSVHYYL